VSEKVGAIETAIAVYAALRALAYFMKKRKGKAA
jgi:hypothetical protein